jgi:hypothetical protein
MRIVVSAQHEASTELLATLREIKRAYAQLKPEAIGLLKPEKAQRGTTYEQLAPRAALETLVRVAAAEAEIDIEFLARQTVRARLGIAQSGDLASHVSELVSMPVGPYWNAGRNVAALAALAVNEVRE